MNDFGEFISELLAKTDIVQLISRYVPVSKKGNTYWCCCPFHHESDPSFSVSESKQVYHCFGCKESGNALTFVQKIESVDFMDAVKILAENAHMEIPEFRREGNREKYDAKKKDRLYELMRAAARHYHDNLSLPVAAHAREYLKKREIDERLIVKFGLGYSINGGEMIEHLQGLGYTKAEMKEAGLIEQRADSWYDVFYGRLMFPIIDNFGKVVAFGGRTLKADYEFAKYRNSSATPIFDKSRTIYGINLLKKKKQRESVDSVIMTEGYMDVIALHKGGFDTAVASMGTALTLQQAKTLKNYAKRVYISYDGDGAGQKATMRGLDILESAGLSVRVVELPEGMDPDDVIKKLGRETYAKLLSEAVTLTAFKIKTLKKSYDLTDPEEKSKFAVEAIRVIKRLQNPVEQEEYVNLVQSLTGYSKSVLMKQAELSASESEPPPSEVKPSSPKVEGKLQRAAMFVLASLIAEKIYANKETEPDFMPSEGGFREVYEAAVRDVDRSGQVRMDVMYSSLSEEGAELLSRLADYEFMEGDGKEKYRDCVRTLKIARLQEEINAETEKSKITKGEEQRSILARLAKLTKKLNELKTEN